MSKIICIDPGHGGLDPGGGTNNHWKEKDMVLNISLEQKKHFERNGIKVVMTRTSDEYMDSLKRTNRVKASGAKYCISNHINAFNGQAKGAETIHSIHANKTIAEGVLNALVKVGARYRRVFSRKGTNGDWYYMHRMTGAVNTVIIEYGFADDEEDTQKILKDWKEYAEVVAKYYIEHVFKQTYLPALTQDGWQQSNGKWYFYKSGKHQTGWQKIKNKWYYLNSSGIMQTGWVQIADKWYYLNPNGDMATGWKKVENEWYLLDSSGAMQVGWHKVKGKWYYMYPSGRMAADQKITIGKDGAMQ